MEKYGYDEIVFVDVDDDVIMVPPILREILDIVVLEFVRKKTDIKGEYYTEYLDNLYKSVSRMFLSKVRKHQYLIKERIDKEGLTRYEKRDVKEIVALLNEYLSK